jgi:alkaline phosphatase D
MARESNRRGFLRTAAGGMIGLAAAERGAFADRSAAATVAAAPEDLPTGITRTWLAPAYWANRLQDWRLSGGRIECLQGGKDDGGRTVSVLTRELVAGNVAATIAVRTGTLAAGAGFSGFVVGAGGGALDYRAAALVMRAGGIGGGIFCTYESDGHVRFREHADEKQQLTWPIIAPSSSSGPAPARSGSEDVLLTLEIIPAGAGIFTLSLTARDFATGTLRSTATRTGIAEQRLLGGILLVSSPAPGAAGARYWFRAFSATGSKVAVRPDRALGPILGTLYSLSGSVLKLTGQLFPVGATESRQALLQYRVVGTTAWINGPTATLDSGYAAHFRLSTWDPTRSFDYRVVYAPGTAAQATYIGRIARDPTTKSPIVVGLLDCTIHSFRSLDRPSSGAPRIAGEHFLGLYTESSLYFPYAQLAANLAKQQPDLLVALGDQLYEHRPTIRDPAASPTLDYLSKYYLWLLAFRSLTKNRPTIVMMDDHDVTQGNIWGHEGAAAPNGDQNQGGYVKAAAFINTIQRVQTWHNPDPFDPTPVLQGISVYYGMFRYGGSSFAILEDRKFKGGDADGLQADGTPYPPTAELLGGRQETFLTAWASADAGLPKVCLTQTLYGCLLTDPDGAALRDFDSNGYPPAARLRAVKLVKAARALLVAGDQHLGSLVRHGITGFADGPVQFTIPAAGSAWQRWFEPATALPNPEATPYTCDFTDAFGNHMHVLAVANPSISLATFRAAYGTAPQNLGDRSLKRDGYGIVRIDKTNHRFIIECWPWDADPTVAGQYPGWPYTLPFANA